MSQNSDVMELLSLDLPSAKCVLLGGDCECYLPKKECNYIGVHVFFSKKGRIISKEEKLRVLNIQIKRLHKRITKDNNKLFDIGRLVDEIEMQE